MLQIGPQPGRQEDFLSTGADIALYGGAAGGGKSYGLLLEMLRNIDNPDYGAVIFRRNTTHIIAEGGLWDESEKLYYLLDAKPRDKKTWTFPAGSKITLTHLEYEKTVYNWQGAQIVVIGFDELTHFTKKQFFYMLSRNRTTCGIKPYIRATCNPDSDSWVAEFIAWWIDQDTGYAIEERGGVIRYFIRSGDAIVWGSTKQELLDNYPNFQAIDIKSFTFIPSKLQDNKILMEKDPSYRANLLAQDRVERERLLYGNWKIRPASGLYFKREFFDIVDTVPSNSRMVRYWDLAATEKTANNNPDWTVGVKMAKDSDDHYYIADVIRMQRSPLAVEKAVHNTATQDGKTTMIGISQDPGQAGKTQASQFIRKLAGYVVRTPRETGDKVTRASAFSAQCEGGNVSLVRGLWNDDYLNELESFPPESSAAHDDQVDASSGGFNFLTVDPLIPRIRSL